MKDLYSLDDTYILKSVVKGHATTIRHLRNERRRLLAGSRKTRVWAKRVDPPEDQEKAIAQADAQRTLAVHLGEMAPTKYARHALLAYGYVRGVPYRVMERTTRKGHEPSIALIASWIHPDIDVTSKRMQEFGARLKEWLAVPAPESAHLVKPKVKTKATGTETPEVETDDVETDDQPDHRHHAVQVVGTVLPR